MTELLVAVMLLLEVKMSIYHPQVKLTIAKVINYKMPIKISPKLPVWCMIIWVPHTIFTQTLLLALLLLQCCKIQNCQEMITRIYTTKKVKLKFVLPTSLLAWIIYASMWFLRLSGNINEELFYLNTKKKICCYTFY